MMTNNTTPLFTVSAYADEGAQTGGIEIQLSETFADVGIKVEELFHPEELEAIYQLAQKAVEAWLEAYEVIDGRTIRSNIVQ